MSKLKKKCFEHKIPENGWYFFKEYGKATWIITDKIRILKIITEVERQKILSDVGYNEAKAFVPYKNAILKRKKSA